ncbi:MAG: hypothetical protein GXO39_05410 [Thermotogae bacterium]|nr:hypothetical protein [Thermotogota bacterium]
MFNVGDLLSQFLQFFWGWGFVYQFAGGIAAPNVGDLNRRLWEYGYPGVPEAYISSGGGWQLFVKGWGVGRYSFSILPRKVVWQDRLIYVDGGEYYYFLGKMFPIFGKNYVFPSLGIGKSHLNLIVGKNVSVFDSLLTSPGTITMIRTEPWILVPQVEAVWKKERFLFFGARVSYPIAFTRGDWKMGDVSVKGGPNSALDGLRLHLFVGFGYVVL